MMDTLANILSGVPANPGQGGQGISPQLMQMMLAQQMGKQQLNPDMADNMPGGGPPGIGNPLAPPMMPTLPTQPIAPPMHPTMPMIRPPDTGDNMAIQPPADFSSSMPIINGQGGNAGGQGPSNLFQSPQFLDFLRNNGLVQPPPMGAAPQSSFGSMGNIALGLGTGKY